MKPILCVETCMCPLIYAYSHMHRWRGFCPSLKTHLHRCWCIWCGLESRAFCFRLLGALYFWSLHQSHQDDSDKLSIIEVYTTLTYRQVERNTHFSCECCWLQRIILYALRAMKMNKVNNHVCGIKHTNLCPCMCMCEGVCSFCACMGFI